MSRLSRPAKPKPGNLEANPFGRDGRLRPVWKLLIIRVLLKVRPGLSILLMVSWLMVDGCALLAQADDPSTINLQPSTPEGLTGVIVGLVTQFPWLATALLVIGGLRLVLKPLMLAIEWYAKSTPNPNDDVAVLKFQAGPIYKWLAIGLDVIGSVKLPAIKPPGPAGTPNLNRKS
jgi:hypothetical protein